MNEIIRGMDDFIGLVASNGGSIGNPEQVSAALIRRIFNPLPWKEAIRPFLKPILERLYVRGAMNQAAIHNLVIEPRRRLTARRALDWAWFWDSENFRMPIVHKQTEEERLAALGLNLPIGISFEMPEWLKKRMDVAISTVMAGPYWVEFVETTKDDIATIIRSGAVKGWSIKKIRDKIVEVAPEYSKVRAERIARTETIGILNRGGLDILRQTSQETAGAIDGKSWLGTLDERIRGAHLEADGQIRKIDEPFVVGGEEAMYPGDENLSAWNRINCRCTILSEQVDANLSSE